MSNIKSILPFIFHAVYGAVSRGLYVFGVPISLVMIVRIRVLHLVITKSEVWPICNCVGLGHEITLCVICPMFLCSFLLLAFVRTRVLMSQSRLNNGATMEADILTFTGILTPEAASVTSCFPFDITIRLSWFPLLCLHYIPLYHRWGETSSWFRAVT